MGQYIGFKIGKEEYAVPILMVQEIMKANVNTTKLPQSSDYMLGIINLRGKTLSIMDLRKRLGLFHDDIDNVGNIVVVLHIGKITFGVLVDKITGVMTIPEDIIETSMTIIDTEAVKGIANLSEDRMVILIDFSKILSIDEASLLDEEDITETQEMADGKVLVTKRIPSMGGDVFIKEIRDSFSKKATDKGIEEKTINEIIENVEKLLEAFASGNTEDAEAAINYLSRYGEKEIFSEVGKLTRKVHNSIKDFKSALDPRLTDLAKDIMPDATDELEWVIAKTEAAASKTISLSEQSQSEITTAISNLSNIEETDKNKENIAKLKNALSTLDSNLVEIMLAQEFQDITGQIIKKVVRLVAELEIQLVDLIKSFGVKIEPSKAITLKPETATLTGPVKKVEDVMHGQEDIDALLSELGF
ncbi:chemotaxis protein CheZ [Candidatus Magnetoovum chiemensis]|nr:chemotaxis protein CheZ [Candidatus Magnetoovum chiemensis]